MLSAAVAHRIKTVATVPATVRFHLGSSQACSTATPCRYAAQKDFENAVKYYDKALTNHRINDYLTPKKAVRWFPKTPPRQPLLMLPCMISLHRFRAWHVLMYPCIHHSPVYHRTITYASTMHTSPPFDQSSCPMYCCIVPFAAILHVFRPFDELSHPVDCLPFVEILLPFVKS